MVNFIKVIRWPNLIIISLLMVSCRFWVFEHYLNRFAIPLTPALSNLHFYVLLISILLITIGGYIINDIEDVAADKINKPGKNIFEDKNKVNLGIKLYYATTILGIILALWIGWQYDNIQLAMPHLFAAGLLWVYAKNFSKSFLTGNVIVAVLSALVPITYLLIESNTFIIENLINLRAHYGNAYKEGPVAVLLIWTLLMATFAFTISLSREIIKDIQDTEGDSRIGGKSLAISYGEKTAFYLGMIPLLLNIPLAYALIEKLPLFADLKSNLLIYIITLTITFPSFMLYFSFKKGPKSKMHSQLLKAYMLLGILSSTIVLWMI